MIEIITENVEMPDIYQRKFQKKCKNYGNQKEEWMVIDTETNNVGIKVNLRMFVWLHII